MSTSAGAMSTRSIDLKPSSKSLRAKRGASSSSMESLTSSAAPACQPEKVHVNNKRACECVDLDLRGVDDDRGGGSGRLGCGEGGRWRLCGACFGVEPGEEVSGPVPVLFQSNIVRGKALVSLQRAVGAASEEKVDDVGLFGLIVPKARPM